MIRKITFAALIIVAFSSVLYAQNSKPISQIGLSVEAGFPHLFVGSPFSNADIHANPGSGVGGGGALFYELQHKHFLFRTGLGMDYTYNTNRLLLHTDASIAEYPSMQLHYDFNKYKENTTYGNAYVPVYVGGIWQRFFFLAGAKLGLLQFGGSTRPATKADIWATDADVLDPMYELYTHHLNHFTFTGERSSFNFNPINAMASLELGINLDKRAWADEKAVAKMDREARYRELHRRRTFAEMLHYRLSFFADYGFMNLRSGDYQPNPVALDASAPEGGLVAFNSVSELIPHSIFGFDPLKNAKVNNFLFGVKFAIMYEIPRKAPKKGSMANPYIYSYVTDQLTEKPLGNARVQIVNAKQPKQKLDRATDSKFGRVGKAFPVGEYKVSVSRAGYFPSDTMLFRHEDRYDTIRVALYPEQTFRARTTDAKTGRPIAATVTIYNEYGEPILSTSVDSAANEMSTILDGRKRYSVCASAKNYHDACDSITSVTELKNLRLEPKSLRKFILQNMFFATDKTRILPTSEAALQQLYNMLSENPDIRIKIIGHTDDVASDEYNQRLSEGRARSVRKEMIDRGIDGKRIEIEGHGEKDPIVANDSEEHRQMNRRVEIEILSGLSDDHEIANEQLKH